MTDREEKERMKLELEFQRCARVHTKSIGDTAVREECITEIMKVRSKYQTLCDWSGHRTSSEELVKAFRMIGDGLKMIDQSGEHFAMSVTLAQLLPQYPDLIDMRQPIIKDIMNALVGLGEDASVDKMPDYRKNWMRCRLVEMVAILNAVCIRFNVKANRSKSFAVLAEGLVDYICLNNVEDIDALPDMTTKVIIAGIEEMERIRDSVQGMGIKVPPLPPKPAG